MKISIRTNSITEIVKDTKTIPNNLTSFAPYNKSEIKSKMIASTKKGKYIIPKNAKMTDTQKGIKSTESKIITEAKIRSNIPLYYTLPIKIQIEINL